LGRTVRKLVTDLDGFGLEVLNLARRQHLRQPEVRAVQVRAHARMPGHTDDGSEA
jgi:hypothetical protein